MLKVERRIEKLQRAFGISEERAPPFEHTIVFIDSEGRQEWIKGDASE